jgi:hypothetical protein
LIRVSLLISVHSRLCSLDTSVIVHFLWRVQHYNETTYLH